MRLWFRSAAPILLVAMMPAPVLLSGCMGHARVYDPDHHDYHRWDSSEAAHYQQWERDTHRAHSDFQRRNDQEQREYWDWRHKTDQDHH